MPEWILGTGAVLPDTKQAGIVTLGQRNLFMTPALTQTMTQTKLSLSNKPRKCTPV